MWEDIQLKVVGKWEDITSRPEALKEFLSTAAVVPPVIMTILRSACGRAKDFKSSGGGSEMSKKSFSDIFVSTLSGLIAAHSVALLYLDQDVGAVGHTTTDTETLFRPDVIVNAVPSGHLVYIIVNTSLVVCCQFLVTNFSRRLCWMTLSPGTHCSMAVIRFSCVMLLLVSAFSCSPFGRITSCQLMALSRRKDH